MKKLISRVGIRLAIMLAEIPIVSKIINFPIIKNDIALTQMENTNDYLYLSYGYEAVKSAVVVIAVLIAFGLSMGIVKSIYRYVKEKNEKGETI